MTPHLDSGALDTEAVGDVLGADRITGHAPIMQCRPRVDKCIPRDYNRYMSVTKLRKVESGEYRTEDGWTISRVDHYTTCEAPHPDRSVPDGYCWGNEEHPAVTWEVIDPDGHERGMGWDTKREAVAYLEMARQGGLR